MHFLQEYHRSNVSFSERHIQEAHEGAVMLPKPGTYFFPWEVSAGQVPDGDTLRTFGRLCSYDMTQSQVTLMAQLRSDQHPILICTKLVEPFQAQLGSLYTVLGELEHQKDGSCVVKARVLTCVEGMNLPLLEQAIREQRLYQQERDSGQ
ncbi:CST complex subunit TEN1 isoform X1 [Bos indicus x Bos taurus]|nr:CST complex subunit TEN1 isoform X1 [Bos indicus x Bos taurus]